MANLITIPASAFSAIGRQFFALLRDVSNGFVAGIDTVDLARAIPALRYKDDASREALFSRGTVARLSDGSGVFNDTDLFGTVTDFIQEKFPTSAGPRDQVISIQIDKRIEAKHTINGTTYSLSFTTGKPFVTFPDNPDNLPAQTLRSVKYDGNTCTFVFDTVTIVADYNRQSFDFVASGHQRSLHLPFVDDSEIRIVTEKNLTTNFQSQFVDGFFRIETANTVAITCDPQNPYCDPHLWRYDIQYESGHVDVPSGVPEAEAIRQACIDRQNQNTGTPFTRVTWANVKADNQMITRAAILQNGQLLVDPQFYAVTCPDGTEKPICYTNPPNDPCFVATAVLRDAAILNEYHEFRDLFLSRYAVGRAFIRLYYKVGPTLARICSSSRPLSALARSLLVRCLPVIRILTKNAKR